jgi:hypothetical protein
MLTDAPSLKRLEFVAGCGWLQVGRQPQKCPDAVCMPAMVSERSSVVLDSRVEVAASC